MTPSTTANARAYGPSTQARARISGAFRSPSSALAHHGNMDSISEASTEDRLQARGSVRSPVVMLADHFKTEIAEAK